MEENESFTDVNVWGFDIGQGSIGESVFKGGAFQHLESLLIDKDFGETKTAASLRRANRTRQAHKAREVWLEKCLADCGIEILKRRKVDVVDGVWKLLEKGDKRMEMEFPPSGDGTCYNSIALRCKLLLGEKLESWQVFKALNSAIQNRGYDDKIVWKESDTKKSKDDDYSAKLELYEREKVEIFEDLDEQFDYPCFFKAFKMGLWNPKNPNFVDVRIDHKAEPAKGYVIPRKYVEAEFVRLIEMASLQYPKLKGKAKFILYGITETPYASFYPELREKFNLKRGAESDWTALGQKIPRFNNRIIDKCKLIPRLNVCAIKPLAEIKFEEDFLYYDITLALKLLNLRFFKDDTIKGLSFEEFKAAFDLAKSHKYKLTAATLKKFLVKIGGFVVDENQAQIEAPRSSGRASFSRPAMRILKELIFSGSKPADFYEKKINEIQNIDINKGLVKSDLDFLKLMGDCQWNAIHIPDVETYQYAMKSTGNGEALVNKLIGSQKDPIVRARLAFFYSRIKSLEAKFGVPDRVMIEFVREDFLGKDAKKKLQKSMNDRASEKKRLAKELDELASETREEEQAKYRRSKMLLKYELFKKQGGVCLYTGDSLSQTELGSLEIEHIVPRSRGGSDSIYNYVLTRENTNKEKGNRTPYEWLSGDPEKWKSYCERVRQKFGYLGKKRCELLVSERAEELVEKYTALAETAWISKLAQRIVCLHFGFQFGGLTGEKRVFTVSGNTTARIRSVYGLNKLLHEDSEEASNLTMSEIIQKSLDNEKKNRANKKHHALDAMCLCFAPTSTKKKRSNLDEIFPPSIKKNVLSFFGGYLETLIPNEVATKKPRLEESIYSLRKIGGKTIVVRKFNLLDLAYTGLNPKYTPDAIEKLTKEIRGLKGVAQIINPVIAKLVQDFIATNPDENEWKRWCENLRMPSENGDGARIKRVLVFVGNPDEYKDLSKDSCGAYRKGDSHKGQIVWETKDGKYKVAPIYVHSSKFKVFDELKKREDFKQIVGSFRSHCMVELTSDVLEKDGSVLLKRGIYMLNTMRSDGWSILTNANGISSKAIALYRLINAGMKRISLEI